MGALNPTTSVPGDISLHAATPSGKGSPMRIRGRRTARAGRPPAAGSFRSPAVRTGENSAIPESTETARAITHRASMGRTTASNNIAASTRSNVLWAQRPPVTVTPTIPTVAGARRPVTISRTEPGASGPLSTASATAQSRAATRGVHASRGTVTRESFAGRPGQAEVGPSGFPACSSTRGLRFSPKRGDSPGSQTVSIRHAGPGRSVTTVP